MRDDKIQQLEDRCEVREGVLEVENTWLRQVYGTHPHTTYMAGVNGYCAF